MYHVLFGYSSIPNLQNVYMRIFMKMFEILRNILELYVNVRRIRVKMCVSTNSHLNGNCLFQMKKNAISFYAIRSLCDSISICGIYFETYHRKTNETLKRIQNLDCCLFIFFFIFFLRRENIYYFADSIYIFAKTFVLKE